MTKLSRKHKKVSANELANELALYKAIESFRRWAVKTTGGCNIQDGFPCGTCMLDSMKRLGIKEDKEHNKPIDRTNEFWRAIQQMREVHENGH